MPSPLGYTHMVDSGVPTPATVKPPPTPSWTGVLAMRGTASCRRESNPHTPHRRQGGFLQRTAVTGWSALLNLTTARVYLNPQKNPDPIVRANTTQA